MKEHTRLFDEHFFFLQQQHNLFPSQFIVLLRVPYPWLPREYQFLFRLEIIGSLGDSRTHALLETHVTRRDNSFDIFITGIVYNLQTIAEN